jgi:Zn-dependent membrane protease YugP
METPNSIGIKLFVLALLFIVIRLFVLCSASDSALQFVFSNSLYESTAKWETSQIFKEDRLLVHIYLDHL